MKSDDAPAVGRWAPTRTGVALAIIGVLLMLVGSLVAHAVETVDGIRVEDVRFKGDAGQTMSALLYVPAGATPERPAPGVLAVHGYLNARETQSAFALEYARRGWVVLALDQTGHGRSGGKAFSSGFGGPDGLRYLRTLPFVDRSNVALEGHSMGGGAILAAAKAMPDGYKAMVLEGSATATVFSPAGDRGFPRNLAIVFSKYDEFSDLMWDVSKPADVGSSPKLRALFTSEPRVKPGTVYGSIPAGDARILYQPATNHPGDHLSEEAVADSIDWLQRNLVGGTQRAPADQIWFDKELATGVALLGFGCFVLGFFDLALGLAAFSTLRGSAAAHRHARDRRWTRGLVIMTLVPALSYFPAVLIASKVVPATVVLPQGVTNQIVFWAVANGAVALLLLGTPRRSSGSTRATLRSIALACTVIAASYVPVWLTDRLLHVDFRFWLIAIKVPSVVQLGAAAVYAPFLVFFMLANSASWARNLAISDERASAQYVTAVTASIAGFLFMMALVYAPFFLAGRPWSLPGFDPKLGMQALFTVLSISIVPVLAFAAVVTVFCWRRTGSTLPGSILGGALIALHLATSQATHAWG